MKYIIDDNNRKYKRVSRWIRIESGYITKNHRLSDFADFSNDEKYGLLDYFRFHDKWYAIGQFMRLSQPYFFIDENDKKSFLCGYDALDGYHPLLCEIDDTGEYIRLFESVVK